MTTFRYVQGYYRPSVAALEGAGFGAWVGGLFGLLMGFGMFVFPVAGTLIVLGPLAGMIAGAVSGAGVGALVNGLMALDIPKDRRSSTSRGCKPASFWSPLRELPRR